MSKPVYRYRIGEDSCVLTDLGYITVSDLRLTDRLNDTKRLYPILNLFPVVLREAVRLNTTLFRSPLYAGYGTEVLTVRDTYLPIHLFQIFPILKKPLVLKAKNYIPTYYPDLISVYRITRKWRQGAKAHYEKGDFSEIPQNLYTHQFCLRESPEKFPRGLLNIPLKDIELMREFFSQKFVGVQFPTDFYHCLAFIDALGLYASMEVVSKVALFKISKVPIRYNGFRIDILTEPTRLVEIHTEAPHLVVNHVFLKGNQIYELYQDNTDERLQVSGSARSDAEDGVKTA